MYTADKDVDFQFQKIIDYPFHWHNSIEIIMVLEGSIHIAVVDETITLKKGGIEVLNINQVHRIWKTDEDNVVLMIHINAELIENYYPEIATIWLSHEFLPSYCIDDSELKHLMRLLYDLILEITLKDGKNDDSSYQLAKLIIDTFDIMKTLYGAQPYVLSRIRRMFEYVRHNNNYLNRITLKDIVIHTDEYLNLDYLSAQIRVWVGENFQSVLNYFRIEHSVKQLIGTNKSISEISYECGYSAPRYFLRHFKACFPDGPKAFRAKYKDRLADTKSNSYENVSKEVATEKVMSLIENAPQRESKLQNSWIPIHLDEVKTSSFSEDNKAFLLFKAQDLCNCDQKNQLIRNIHGTALDRIQIDGLFSNAMLVESGENKTGCSNWDNVIDVICLLESCQIKPIFMINPRNLTMNESLILLKNFIHYYVSAYGYEAVNDWRFELSSQIS